MSTVREQRGMNGISYNVIVFMNALYYDNDMHTGKRRYFFCVSVCWSFKCVSLSQVARWSVTFLTDQGDVLLAPCMNEEAISDLNITTSL